jgi:hypothetical protein
MKKHRVLSISGVVSFLMLFMFFQPAAAGMVGTLSLQPEYQPFTDVLQTRQEIQNQLIKLGVEQQQAEIRVANMSDTQINELSTRISELPAGASVGGTLFLIFIIFVITDIIGATDIFPFIHPVR